MKIAINGFGRIGRLFFRQAFGHPDIDIVAINDLGSVQNLAYLLQYDTVYRKFPSEIRGLTRTETRPSDNGQGSTLNYLSVNEKKIPFFSQKDPTKLPWKDLDVDLVVEATGVFSEFGKANVHLEAGAKRVLITAPAKDEDGELGRTVLMGVNEEALKSCKISSNGSCTTNATSPVMKILSKDPGIVKASLTTVHSYTATQSLVDGPVRHGSVRKGRAAAENIIPATTGAAISTGRAVEEIRGIFDGMAIRVPSVTGSVSDITFVSSRKTSVEEINTILEEAAGTDQWKGIIKVSHDPIVSSDVVGEPYGAIIDAKFTKVIDGDLVKVLSWYDNEWGYTSTLLKHALKIGKLL